MSWCDSRAEDDADWSGCGVGLPEERCGKTWMNWVAIVKAF